MDVLATQDWLQGRTRHQLDTELRAGRLIRPRRGMVISADGSPADQHLRRLRAAARFLGPATYFAHGSAGVIHELPLMPTRHGETVVVVRAGGGHGVVHPTLHARKASLDPGERVVVAGLPVTSLARTVADLVRELPFAEAVMVADAALARGLDRADLLNRTAKGRGCRIAARALEFADRRAESPGESFSRARICEWGLPRPELQRVIRDRAGRVLGRVDFWWEAFGLVGEFDGAVKYGPLMGPGERVEDVVLAEKRREQHLRDLGLGVVRWTWPELWSAELAGRLARAMKT